MAERSSRSKFRHRGFKCSKCSLMTMVFGVVPEPDICSICGEPGPLKLQWDNLVDQMVTVKPYRPENV